MILKTLKLKIFTGVVVVLNGILGYSKSFCCLEPPFLPPFM